MTSSFLPLRLFILTSPASLLCPPSSQDTLPLSFPPDLPASPRSPFLRSKQPPEIIGSPATHPRLPRHTHPPLRQVVLPMSSAWACSPGGLWSLPLPLLASRCPRLSCGPGPPASPARCVRKQGRTDTLSLSHRYGDGRLAMRSAAPWLPHPRAAATPVLASRPGSAGDHADPQHDCDNAAALLRLLPLPLGKPTPSSLLHLISALPPRSLSLSPSLPL